MALSQAQRQKRKQKKAGKQKQKQQQKQRKLKQSALLDKIQEQQELREQALFAALRIAAERAKNDLSPEEQSELSERFADMQTAEAARQKAKREKWHGLGADRVLTESNIRAVRQASNDPKALKELARKFSAEAPVAGFIALEQDNLSCDDIQQALAKYVSFTVEPGLPEPDSKAIKGVNLLLDDGIRIELLLQHKQDSTLTRLMEEETDFMDKTQFVWSVMVQGADKDLIKKKVDEFKALWYVFKAMYDRTEICLIYARNAVIYSKGLRELYESIPMRALIYICFDCYIKDNPDGTVSGYSDCMMNFGLPEMEIIGAKASAERVREFIAFLFMAVMTQELELEDGGIYAFDGEGKPLTMTLSKGVNTSRDDVTFKFKYAEKGRWNMDVVEFSHKLGDTSGQIIKNAMKYSI